MFYFYLYFHGSLRDSDRSLQLRRILPAMTWASPLRIQDPLRSAILCPSAAFQLPLLHLPSLRRPSPIASWLQT